MLREDSEQLSDEGWDGKWRPDEILMQSNGITVRWACIEDKEEIARLLHALIVYTASFYGEPECTVKPFELVRSDVERQLRENGTVRFVVAEWGGTITGICAVELSYSTWHGKPYIILNDVFVDERFRRRGIGTALLAFVRDYAHSIDCCRIDLLVEQDNWCARKLYEYFGFKWMPRASYTLEIRPSPGVP